METEPTAIEVSFGGEELWVQLNDGRKIAVPLSWFPRLSKASPEQRRRFELIGDGEFIHWPEIDEDLSVAGLLVGWHPGSKSTLTRRKGSSHRYVLLNQSPFLGAPTIQSLQMLGGAKLWGLPTWDAKIENANQTFLSEAKWFGGGMTLQKLAGADQFIKAIGFVPRAKAAVRQGVRAFNPETEGRMPRAA